MITTVVLNPAIDVRYSFNDFLINKSNRCSNYQKTAGGKGVNVSKILRTIGHKVQATGFLGGNSGAFISSKLDKLIIDDQFIRIDEETRTCIAILNDNRRQTEILEEGPYIKEEFVSQFYDRYRQLLNNSHVVCASGSLPKGLEDDIYYQLIKWAKEKDIKFVLDTSGMALKTAIAAKPYLIKPNCDELEDWCGKRLENEEDIIQQALEIQKLGVENVVVSLGEGGAILVNQEGVYKACIPEVSVKNPVGSGDSMIGGIIHSITERMNSVDTLKYACACGIANAMEEETGKISVNTVNALKEEINIFTL
ncbi:1-phosphofructokinase [Peribacillus muralis]|uniref:1-phosphofructokinase n=1 Tax=Peribacillus muralis TaxID=264697 RepID=UPI001F4D7239|nr:1-phosphofructokinase [Peribacillus muralis]MCK1992937.1 1-phosphofructokinase [Peribacillus muralis]MCK2013492.1 1-phosphofructokinase [Peribacillus muralis]